MYRIKCVKNVIGDSGKTEFSEGKNYDVEFNDSTVNDCGEQHYVRGWGNFQTAREKKWFNDHFVTLKSA